jgi:hypothetical protein
VQSLSDQSPSVIVNADTGEKVPHWAELDDNLLFIENRTLMIWPAVPLEDSVHYVIGLRSLVDTLGGVIPPSDAFKCLRDNTPCKDKDTEQRRKEFEVIFTVLEKTGFQRESLQLAWDFRTASRQSLTGRLVFARDDSMHRVGVEGPQYKIVEVKDNYSPFIFRKIKGIMSAPMYTDSPFPGAKLVLDARGLPVYQAQTDVTFTVLIPTSLSSLAIVPEEAGIMQYGHGLFGSQDEVESTYLQEIANTSGYVMAACDWWGMTQYDVPAIVEMLALDLSNLVILPDRLTQGMINALLLMRLMKGRFASDPYVTFHGKSVVNKEHAYYYGNSLGGILGEVYMAATQDVVRGTLGVNGGPFGLLLPRSLDFSELEDLIRVLFPDPVNYCISLALMNMIWSRLEPNAYMSSITSNPLPDTPTHTLLYQYNLGDGQVNIVATFSVARASGALMFQSNVQPTFLVVDGSYVNETSFGFGFIPDNTVVVNSSVAVGFDCGAPPIPATNRPPDPRYDTHNCVRHNPTAQKQMIAFFKTGEIRNLCKGPCRG